MREISTSELKQIRLLLLEQQNFKCAICSKHLTDSLDQHVDHQHLFKSAELGLHGGGLIRGVLCRDCNALEGKIWNALHRFGKTKAEDPVGSRCEYLKKLLDYYNNNFQHQEQILHPKEKRPERLQKSEYNRLFKKFKSLEQSYKRDGTLKPFPKFTGKWTKLLKELADG